MSKKSRNSVKIPSEIATVPNDPKSTTAALAKPDPLSKAITKAVSNNNGTTTEPMAGSPTTGNSGLVSAKKTPRGKPTPRQRANVVARSKTANSNNNELRISQKRVLVTSIANMFLKNEPLLTKMLKYFVNSNMLVDPVNQRLESDIYIQSNENKLGVSLRFNLLPSYKQSASAKSHNTISKEINNIDKDLKVSFDCNLDKDNFVHALTTYTPTTKRTVSK